MEFCEPDLERLSIDNISVGDKLVVDKPFGGMVKNPNFKTEEVLEVTGIDSKKTLIAVTKADGTRATVTRVQIDVGCVKRQP